jgi:hypothetical protein
VSIGTGVSTIEIERKDTYDFVKYSSDGKIESIAEMKKWMTTKGLGEELDRIQKDIVKVRNSPYPGFVIIVRCNPVGTSLANVKILADLIPYPLDVFSQPSIFPSRDYRCRPCEAFVVGIMVDKEEL